jgi:hypothetical protein
MKKPASLSRIKSMSPKPSKTAAQTILGAALAKTKPKPVKGR